MLRRFERLEIIFRGLKQGQTADQIDTALVIAEKGVKTAVGLRSEEKAMSAITGLPCVRGAHLVRHNSIADLKGKDIIVYLREGAIESWTRLHTVSVQVKSSRYQIDRYCSVLRNRHSLSEESLTVHLMEEKLILINGQSDERVIQASFTNQLQQMHEYHQTKPLHRIQNT